MSLLKVDLLTSWYHIINQKIIEKSQNMTMENELMLLIKIFLIQDARTKILLDKHFLQNANQEYKETFSEKSNNKISKKFKHCLCHFELFFQILEIN